MRLHFHLYRQRRRKAIAGGGEGYSCKCYAPVTGYMHRLLLFFSTGCKFTGFFFFSSQKQQTQDSHNHVDQRSRKQRLRRPPQLHKQQQQQHSTLRSERGKHCPNLEKKTQTNRDTTPLRINVPLCFVVLLLCRNGGTD